ncbi:hypothetical protein N7475_008453 [Penicillium sp. IBT 31633x]|nr:hypothetical protein N7475_008453 [Penicillium sp. IBT 31633x]
MTQIPTPPASRPGSEAPEVNMKPTVPVDLAQCLDALLEQYLHLLDKQQKLQSRMADSLSSGFFALAQANFSCPPGRRYGPDYYDGRMKATRKISIQSEPEAEERTNETEEIEVTTGLSDPGYIFSAKSTSSLRPAEAAGNHETELTVHVQSEHPGSSLKNISTANTNSETSDPPELETTPVEKRQAGSHKFRSADPIHWYGILVPQSLRRAQTSFVNAIDNQVPELASTTVKMRVLEQQIGQLRAQLEIEASSATSHS